MELLRGKLAANADDDTMVQVENYTGYRVKVRIDCSRSAITSTFVGKQRTVALGKVALFGFASRMVECEVYHVVDTANSFTIMPKDCGAKLNFYPSHQGGQHAFLTVLVENKDGSWYPFCENHGILRKGSVSIMTSIHVFQNDMRLNSKLGRIELRNYSTRLIWARIDADQIAITSVMQHTATGITDAGGGSATCAKSNLLYYRAEQKNGYTMLKAAVKPRFNCSTFFVDVASTNRFYLSLDFENTAGKLVTHCVNHSLIYQKDKTRHRSPIIIISNHGEAIEFMVEY